VSEANSFVSYKHLIKAVVPLLDKPLTNKCFPSVIWLIFFLKKIFFSISKLISEIVFEPRVIR
jgi:hypothetical protein